MKKVKKYISFTYPYPSNQEDIVQVLTNNDNAMTTEIYFIQHFLPPVDMASKPNPTIIVSIFLPSAFKIIFEGQSCAL